MTAPDPDGEDPPADRESPVGEPVVRGDAAVTGRRASEAVEFDPADAESLERAVRTVRQFADGEGDDRDNVYVLRGAAAAAALTRGMGSYRAAAERAGVPVSFLRKWARVHDLPRSIRRQVATGRIAPSAAKHVARVGGDVRFLLAWATIDAGLTVREVQSVAGEVNDGATVEDALREVGVHLGRVELDLPSGAYRELRRRAALTARPVDEVAADALRAYFDGE